MTLIDTESFAFSTNPLDYAAYGIFLSGNGYNAFSVISTGPFNDNYFTSGWNGAIAFRPITPNSSTIFVGYRVNNLNLGGSIFGISDINNNDQLHLIFTNIGGANIISNGNIIGSIPPMTFPLQGWFYIEIGATIASGTSGSVIVNLNGGKNVLTLTGVNTQGQPTNSIGFLQFNSNGNGLAFGHYYCCDDTGPSPNNTFLGDVRIQSVYPISNNTVAFTPNGLSNNYQNVAVVPPVPSTDYNSSSIVGTQDLFNMPPIATNLSTIFGISVKVLAAKSDSGTRSVETVMVSGSITATSGSTLLSTTPTQIKAIYQTDPNTGLQWTQAGVNAITSGYKISD